MTADITQLLIISPFQNMRYHTKYTAAPANKVQNTVLIDTR